MRNADFESHDDVLECGGCSVRSNKLSRFSNCKLAKYCSVVNIFKRIHNDFILFRFLIFFQLKKACQSKAWKEGHKKLCSQNEAILRLASINRQPFVHRFTFKSDDKKNYLPSFKMLKKK